MDMPLLPDDEHARRREAARQADASLALEGLKASPEADALTDRWVRGELTGEELIARTRALHVRQPPDDPAPDPTSEDG